ncbi:MAG: hypothetical protein COB77_07560 [Gammaproteobacteria bacterium]|nr:MAG: hypothetical protein COB77_07560 [Gammaproteobacteria bacterium]
MNITLPINTNRRGHVSRFIFLALLSAATFAQTNGISTLPDQYRTPLSDLVFDDNKQWRVTTTQDNPWRAKEKNVVLTPRFKATLFPEYDYHSVDDPTTRSLFQNENELERPRTNIFQYTF